MPIKSAQSCKDNNNKQSDFDPNTRKGLLWDKNGAPVMSSYL